MKSANWLTCIALLFTGLASTLAISSCGSGSGDSAAVQPAPQTMNGLVLTLYTGGPTFRFTRSLGDAVSGVEIGAFTMDPEPEAADFIFAGGGEAGQLTPPKTVTGGRYEYYRRTPETGTLVLTGNSSGDGNYMSQQPFRRTYEIIFGTNGTFITGLTINDSGEDIPPPGVPWYDSIIRTVQGGFVPVGFNLATSEQLVFKKIYPDKSLSGQVLVLTPDDPAADTLILQLLTSTFTRFSSAAGNFKDEGNGNLFINDDSTVPIFINYTYRPNPATINEAQFRILDGTTISIYSMTFFDFSNGFYSLNNGTTGTFSFPFLEDVPLTKK